MGLSPGIMVLLGVLIVLYGILVGGTWVRRVPGKTWDTAQTLIFIIIAAVATFDLVFVGARQGAAFQKAKDRLDCVSEQLAAVRAQAPIPNCTIAWDED